MDSPPQKEDSVWNAHMLQPLDHVQTRSQSPKSDSTGRHDSTASSSVAQTTSDRRGSGESRGRRSRPSVTASQAQLASVRESQERKDDREMSQQSTVSWSAGHIPSIVTENGGTDNVLSSRDVLKSFNKVVSRNVEKDASRQVQVSRLKQEDTAQRHVHQKLVKWADSKQTTWTEWLLSFVLPRFQQSPLPDDEELKALARHYYTPRAEVKVHICDFGAGKSEHTIVDLGRVEEVMVNKPDWVDVRWIHAPLGLGLMHSTVEDIFLHEGEPGREFTQSGKSGWSYPESEVFSFVNRQYFQEMRDVYLLLHKRQELHKDLNASTWRADQNASVHDDIDWRADHLAINADFWTMVSSDMPWQLSEGLNVGSYGPMDGLQPVTRQVEEQALCMFDFFREAHLVRDPFRCFHRSDGFLLTLSPMTGVNYLDKNFSKYLQEPVASSFENDDASAVGHCYQKFAQSGTSTWHRRNVEYLLTYILTEVCITPHAMRQGFNAPQMKSAYSSVVQDLKRRRFEKWQPKITVILVRQYLKCIDEVTYITLSLKEKLNLFKVMLIDIGKFEGEDLRMGKMPDNPAGESATQRVEWAIQHLQNEFNTFTRLQEDLNHSLDALFQLRSIEQNELSIVSDSQNKAILLFTAVTVIFMPLSFFTSYFGMNLSGISDSHENQSYFWKVCGTVAFLMVLIVTIAAFNSHLRRTSARRFQKMHKTL